MQKIHYIHIMDIRHDKAQTTIMKRWQVIRLYK